MDDLDHSMHIAEYDWEFFCEESEECDLKQVSLACLDNSDLSEPEDFGSFSLALQRPTGRNNEEERCSELSPEFTLSGQQDDAAAEAEEATFSNWYSKKEVLKFSITNSVQTEVIIDATVQEKQPEQDTCNIKSVQELTPSVNNVNVSEGHKTEGAVSRGQIAGSKGGHENAERERWFVTVNESPVPTRLRGASMKKKRKLKKPRREIFSRRLEQENTLGCGAQDQNEMTVEKIEGLFTLCQSPGANPSVESNPEGSQGERVSDSPSEDETLVHCPKDNKAEAPQETNGTTTSKASSELESVEPEFEDSTEWVSIHSCDSEAYLSAVESEADFARIDFNLEKQLFLCFSSNCGDNPNTEPEAGACSSPFAAALDCEGCVSAGDQTYTQPVVAFSTPGDSSTCDSDAHMGPQMPSDPPQKPAESDLMVPTLGNEQASTSSPVPNVTVAPCFPEDNPETNAKDEGQPRPVFAISAFWAEMEKMTINDILQLRMARSPPQGEPADVPDNGCSIVDTEEFQSNDGGLMDTSDAADSDYFTQTDDSKPDRSSCDFSTSDFEEEYWHFNGQRMSESSLSTREDEESTGSEGKETPVPLDEFPGEYLDEGGSQALLLGRPRRMTKSKSLRNVRAFDTEHLPLQSSPSDDEQLCSSKPLEEDTLEDSLLSLLPAPILLDEYYQISFPEVFEYFFTQDTAKTDCNCVTVYDPEKISVTPLYDYTCTYACCAFEDEMPISSQRSEGRPIPIFSYSHPTVRELTFPEPDYIFLSPDCSEADDISPIRLVSHSLIGAKNGSSAAQGWKTLFSLRKVRFHDKGSIWCRGSGAWMFPADASRRTKAHFPVLSAGRVSSVPSQIFGELGVQQRMLGMGQTSREPDGLFSTLKQSDMCLVCIAFAAWVLTSSDPDAADAWKAALLANVSALSAIQYLRHYVKRKKNLPSS